MQPSPAGDDPPAVPRQETLPWASSRPPQHKNGKARYHQIGLVRGQFGNVPEDKWIKFIADTGFDGWEEATLGTRPAQVRHRRRRRRLRQGTRRPGQEARPGDLHRRHPPARPGAWATSRPPRRSSSARGKGEAKAAYKAWRDEGNNPPRTDPYFVPDERRQADPRSRRRRTCSPASGSPGTWASCRTARSRCRASSARRPTAGATGSCSRRCPATIDGPQDPRRPRRSAWNCSSSASARSGTLCKKYGVTFDLECHPSERAMGDIESAGDYINHMCKAGYEGVVGFNLDGSHMEWQNVSVIAVHPRVRRLHPLRPRQGRVGGPRALPGRPARRPPADGPLGQRLELRHRRHRPRRQLAGGDLHRAEPRRLRRGGVASSGRTTTPSSTPGPRRRWPTAARPTCPPSGMRHDEMLKG